MDKSIFAQGALACALVFASVDVARADLWATGDFQNEAGFGNDWTPADGPMLNDLGGGFYDFSITGSTGVDTRFQMKILDDEGTGPPGFGDPEVPDNGPGSQNTWFLTDSNGDVTVTLDRNTYTDNFFPVTDRIVASTDATELTNFYATGNWMDEAGGAGDWNPGDAMFEMTDMGSGLWQVDATISTPGTYEFKATAGDWPYQWGANGRLQDSSNLEFVVVAEDQEVSFLLDLSKGAIAFDTDTFLDGDTDNDGVVEFEDDFFPIRDNWLNPTFLRSEGNLDNTGDSEGVVDIADFRQWKNAFNGPPELIAQAFASLGVNSVPEPSTYVLALGVGLAALSYRRKRS